MPNPTRPLTPRPVTDWPELLDPVVADMNGTPINVHKLMAHSPALLHAWWDFRNFGVRGGSLGDRLGELVILRVSLHLGAWYEWASHVDRALRVGLELPIIQAVMDRPIAPIFSEDQRLVLQAVDELMTARHITPSTLNALQPQFSTDQIMDLMAIAGMYVVLGYFIKTWDLELDSDVADRVANVTDRKAFETAAANFVSQ